jgi:hypothetical protein
VRQQSTAGSSACQTPRAFSPSYPCEWASVSRLTEIFGFSKSWYRKHIRQVLHAANVPTRQIGLGPRGIRWHVPTVDAVLSREAGAQ